jgi:hypothetical protein
MKVFPYTGLGTDGMDLRDYFAAKAMQGLLTVDLTKRPDGLSMSVSKAAYEMADAMMKAREET